MEKLSFTSHFRQIKLAILYVQLSTPKPSSQTLAYF